MLIPEGFLFLQPPDGHHPILFFFPGIIIYDPVCLAIGADFHASEEFKLEAEVFQDLPAQRFTAVVFRYQLFNDRAVALQSIIDLRNDMLPALLKVPGVFAGNRTESLVGSTGNRFLKTWEIFFFEHKSRFLLPLTHKKSKNYFRKR